MSITKKCKYCNKEFITSRKDRVNFCSRSCGTLNHYNKQKINCKYCNNLFMPKTSTQKFCSKSCAIRVTNIGKVKSVSTKNKISQTIKQKIKTGNWHIPKCETVSKISYCSICDNIIRKNKLTCSKQCETILRKQKRLSGLSKPIGGIRDKSGRGKSGWYKGYFCNSTYELAYVIYNLDHNIYFERNYKGYNYYNPDKDSWFKYYPDFLVNDEYIEIKGYKTNLVEYKLSGVDKKINVLYKQDLLYVFDYVKNSYGFSIAELYKLYDNFKPTFEKNCLICGKMFTTERKNKILCSRRCSGKHVASLKL